MKPDYLGLCEKYYVYPSNTLRAYLGEHTASKNSWVIDMEEILALSPYDMVSVCSIGAASVLAIVYMAENEHMDIPAEWKTFKKSNSAMYSYTKAKCISRMAKSNLDNLKVNQWIYCVSVGFEGLECKRVRIIQTDIKHKLPSKRNVTVQCSCDSEEACVLYSADFYSVKTDNVYDKNKWYFKNRSDFLGAVSQWANLNTIQTHSDAR